MTAVRAFEQALEAVARVYPTTLEKCNLVAELENGDIIFGEADIDEPKYEIDFESGDLVRITDGALKNFEAKVQEVDRVKGKIKVSVNMFGRETPVTLDSLQVKKI